VSRLKALGLFLYDFVVGDDWRIALGVAAAIGLTAIVGGGAWWILPLAVALILALSVRSAARDR